MSNGVENISKMEQQISSSDLSGQRTLHYLAAVFFIRISKIVPYQYFGYSQTVLSPPGSWRRSSLVVIHPQIRHASWTLILDRSWIQLHPRHRCPLYHCGKSLPCSYFHPIRSAGDEHSSDFNSSSDFLF